MKKGAQATTAIEGNTLSDAEVEKVARGDSLPPSKQYQEREVRNILDAMNHLLKAVADDGSTPLITPELIKDLHSRVGRELGEHFDAIPGRFREDERIVGPYRCPRHEDVPRLVDRLCAWLPQEFGFASGRQSFREAVIQAVVSHVYLEWIHPFGDGNGRTGRLLEFYILLRAGNPDIASHILSNFYNETRAEYYRQLDRASKERDLTAFVRYAVQGYHDGLVECLETIGGSVLELAWKALVHDKFENVPHRKANVMIRRRKVALNMPPDRALSPIEIAVLTPQLTRQYAALSARTLLRDLEYLQELHLVKESRGKYQIRVSLLWPQLARRRLAPNTAHGSIS
ncbi:MAG: Fic family protein [Vicinamibacterales bacterium]